MSVRTQSVTIFGGSGFIGRHVVRVLAKQGYRITVAVRNPILAHHLQPLGDVDQIQIMQANILHPWSIERAVEGADHVINLVGILHQSGNQRFNDLQNIGTRAIALAAKGVKSGLTHISAIGADKNAKSIYASTKGLGEEAVFDLVKNAVIMRPSIIFGPEDQFFNKFAAMACVFPALPLIGGGHTLFQPVYVGDVARAIALSVAGTLKGGKIYELGGPEIRSFKQLIQDMLLIIERKNLLTPIPFKVAELIGFCAGVMPNPSLTFDQVTLLRSDTIVSSYAVKNGLTLKGMDIDPRTMASVLPSYLWRFRKNGQFQNSKSV
jgi:uncharacterized protein YbjT (DUF2867 family)